MTNDNEPNTETNLVGYARKNNQGSSIKISINVDAFETCETYTTSDGQTYVPLSMSISAIEKILSGERAVTTVVQTTDN
jgi:hypothetical protein